MTARRKTPQRILVTGSAGRLGRATVKALVEHGHEVRGFDRVPTPGLPADQVFVDDLSDAAVLSHACKDVDVIIHLAATPDDKRFPRGNPPWDDDNFLDELVPGNIVGVYRVLEAARGMSVRRVMLASSVQVIDGYFDDKLFPVGVDVLPRPRYLYACTKVFAEAMGRTYAVKHNIQVVAVRLGWCPRTREQANDLDKQPEWHGVYLSPMDTGRFFQAAVEADWIPGFHVVYCTSNPPREVMVDLEPTKKWTGYEPKDVWPTGLDLPD